MELTIEIKLTWNDRRVTFLNIVDEGKAINIKEISKDYIQKLWLPLEKIEYTNAVIGKVIEGTNQYVYVIAKSEALINSPTAAKEGTPIFILCSNIVILCKCMCIR